MARRPFGGVTSVSGSAQPVFGTTLSGAANPTYDQFAGNVTGANQSTTTIAVTSTVGFRAGDYVLICSQYPPGGTPNIGQVKSILSATSMVVQGLIASAPSGAFVVLAVPAETIWVQETFGSSHTIYLGAASTVSATDTSVFAELTTGGFFSEPTTAHSHAYRTEEYWLNGTSGDSFIPSYSQG